VKTVNLSFVLTRIGAAILFFFALDGLVFRTGYYNAVLEPDSTAGFLETNISLEQHRATQDDNEVIAIGDSRIPLKPRVANVAGTDYRFFTIAVPGTSPRCWYYMLREVDPQARRYAAIVIPLDTYDDRQWEDLRTREAFFGATVRYANAAGTERVVSIVGTDEVDLNRNHISWVSPLGRALMKSAAGDRVALQAPGGTEYLIVLKVCYERISVEPFREPPGAEASAEGHPRRRQLT